MVKHLPTVQDSPLSPRVKRDVLNLGSQIAELNSEIDQLTKAKKSLMDELSELASSNDLDKFAGDGWNLNRVTKSIETIKPELLLEHGVSLAVIQKSTVTKPISYYQINRTKG